MICKGNAEPSNFKLGSVQLSKICKGLVTLWEDLVFKSGEIAKKTFNLTRDVQTYTYTFDYPIKPKHIKGSGTIDQKDWLDKDCFVKLEINYVKSGWVTVYHEAKWMYANDVWNWSTDKELTIKELATQWRLSKHSRESSGGHNHTVYITEWYEKPYQITYVLNGGVLPSDAPKKYLAFDGLSTLPEPTKEGYGFMGWYSENEFTTEVTSIAKKTTGNIKLYAKWGVWVEKTGTIGYTTASASNGWSSNGTKVDLGKLIIPLEGSIYFSWSMSNGQYSTSCGASMVGIAKDNKTSYGLFSHSRGDFGKNDSGSSTETKTVSTNSQVPIRYTTCNCGGGTGGGSTSYSTNAKITKWKELEYQG